jgi:hypothetical protein
LLFLDKVVKSYLALFEKFYVSVNEGNRFIVKLGKLKAAVKNWEISLFLLKLEVISVLI